MLKQFLKDSFFWGVLLWLFGYILGIVLFFIAPPSLLGWIIMPFGIAATLWVLFKKIKSDSLKYYIYLGLVWALIAVVFDYFFLIKIFNPADGYYKLDVYLYYALTFLLPVITGFKKSVTKA